MYQLIAIPAGRECGLPLETGTYDALERKLMKLRAKAVGTGARYFLSACNG